MSNVLMSCRDRGRQRIMSCSPPTYTPKPLSRSRSLSRLSKSHKVEEKAIEENGEDETFIYPLALVSTATSMKLQMKVCEPKPKSSSALEVLGENRAAQPK